jgi:hypothetical protein
MKTLLSLLLIACSPLLLRAEGIGERSKTVTTALETTLKKKAADITKDDLVTLTELKLPHIHIPAFNQNDFDGLTKLKKMEFRSLFHKRGKPNDAVAFTGRNFEKLSTLEELCITDDQLGPLPDDVFAGLTSLKVLDLSNIILPHLPKSMLTLPKIETIYFDGEGMKKEDFALLKEKLGEKLKGAREKE